MSWRDLLRALDEEAAREVEELREATARDAERVVVEARREIEAARAAAHARARAEAEVKRRRALTEVQRERASAVLVEQRRILDEVRAAALERLVRDDARTLRALVDAAAAEVDGASTWTVDAPSVDAVRERLASRHPEVLAAAEIRAAAAPRGGLEVVAGRRVLDGTAAARMARVWPDAEASIARILFGGAP